MAGFVGWQLWAAASVGAGFFCGSFLWWQDLGGSFWGGSFSGRQLFGGRFLGGRFVGGRIWWQDLECVVAVVWWRLRGRRAVFAW